MPVRSLRALTIPFLLLFLAATVGAGYISYHVREHTVVTLVDKRIRAASDDIAGTGRQTAAVILARINALAARRETGDLGFQLSDNAGRRLGGNVRLNRALSDGFTDLGPNDRVAGLSAGRALTRTIGGDLRLTTLAETEPFDQFDRVRLRILMIAFGSIVAIVLVGTALFAVVVSRWISAVSATAEAIIDGDLARRVAGADGEGAFANQAATFNRMLDRIETLVGDVTNLSNDIAHDLRTPLARLRGKLAGIERQATSDSQQAQLSDAIEQCDEILAMFAAALRIAEVDSGKRRAGFASLALDDLVEEVAATLAPAAEETGRTLTIASTAPVRLIGDRQLIAQALINLVENAIRHTAPGTRISLSIASGTQTAVLGVTDDGPGIAHIDQAIALRRFGRLDRSRNVPGHGLGLPFAAAVVGLHHGSIRLEDARPGLRVLLEFPLPEK